MTIEQSNTSTQTGKRTYSVEEIRDILGISRRKAYELCHSNSFRIIRIGRAMRISKASFDNWLDNNEHIGGQ